MSITSPITVTDLAAALRAVVRGDVVTPEEPSFPAACFGVQAGGDVHPELVVIAATGADVAATVRLATRAGRRITVQTPGHQVTVTMDRTILVTTRLLAGVRVDPAASTARVGAGSTWRQVLAAADRYGLSAVPAPVIGLGAAMGRRPGPLGRTWGFAASHLRSLEIVTPTGELREVDPTSDPELFTRAQRTGSAGWITATTIELVPADQMYAGGMWFAVDDAPAIQRRWRQWAPGLPVAAHTSISELMLPAVHEVPADLRGRSMVLVQFVHLGDPVVSARLLAPIRSVAAPVLDGVRVRSTRSAGAPVAATAMR